MLSKTSFLKLLTTILICVMWQGSVWAQFRVCATGQHNNGFNQQASRQACESGDFDCVHIELTDAEYNALDFGQLRNTCDIIVYGFDTDDDLKCNPNPENFEDCEPGDTLWQKHIKPFLHAGGGVIFENPSEAADLMPGVEAVRIWPTNTDGCSVVFTELISGLTDGILDQMECINNFRQHCFANFHQKFVSWNQNLFPFMESEGVRALGGGGFEFDPDCDGGAVVALAGEFPGGGRILLMGPDNDFHASRFDLGPAGDGSFRRGFNQYQMMVNSLMWVAPVIPHPSAGGGQPGPGGP